MNWKNIFEDIQGTIIGGTENEITDFKKKWNIGLCETEIQEQEKNEKNPFPKTDPLYNFWNPIKFNEWKFPQKQFPKNYIDFLKFCNSGCVFINGERELSLFDTSDLREMNIAYHFPEYIKGGVSIGLDGSGNHILFDMRNDLKNEECKIYGVSSSNLEWKDAKLLASNFIEFCKGNKNIDEIINE